MENILLTGSEGSIGYFVLKSIYDICDDTKVIRVSNKTNINSAP